MANRAVRAPETSLYAPVKAFLEQLGFARGVRLRRRWRAAWRAAGGRHHRTQDDLTLELILQGVERLQAADEVWLAVLATRRGRDRDLRAHRLCRLLGFGLLVVHHATGAVEILAEPTPYRPRPNLPQRRRLLKEYATRQGDTTRGGSSRQPIMTAYRQQAIVCATGLEAGPKRPRDLKRLTPDAGKILLRNVYGWFERVQPGLHSPVRCASMCPGCAQIKSGNSRTVAIIRRVISSSEPPRLGSPGRRPSRSDKTCLTCISWIREGGTSATWRPSRVFGGVTRGETATGVFVSSVPRPRTR